MLALAVAIIVVMWRVHRTIERGADEARVLITAGGIVTSWPSVLLTRMHERYTFSPRHGKESSIGRASSKKPATARSLRVGQELQW